MAESGCDSPTRSINSYCVFGTFNPNLPYKLFQGKQLIKYKNKLFVLARIRIKMKSIESMIFKSSVKLINDKKFNKFKK